RQLEIFLSPFSCQNLGQAVHLTTRQRQRQKQRQRKRPRGLMDKASDFESEDCGFESLRGRIFANIPIGRDARSVASEIASMCCSGQLYTSEIGRASCRERV